MRAPAGPGAGPSASPLGPDRAAPVTRRRRAGEVAQVARATARRPIRASGPRRTSAGTSFHAAPGLARNGVEFEAVADEIITQLVRNGLLQLFDLLVAKFDHAA